MMYEGSPVVTKMGFKVALADDQAIHREVYADFLEEKGHTVVAYESGSDLYTQLLIDQPDLIVTDLQMPPGDMGGLWLIEKVRRSDKLIPIIVLSGLGEISLALQALHLGGQPFTGYVQKVEAEQELPLKVHEMMQAVRNHRSGLDMYAKRLVSYPFWSALTSSSQKSLTNGEYLFHSNVGTQGFDFSGAWGAYVKALELELHDKVLPVLRRVSAEQFALHVNQIWPLHEYHGSVSTVEFIRWLQMPRMSSYLKSVGINLSSQTLASLARDLDDIRRERNPRVHSLVDEGARDLEEMRAKVLGIARSSVLGLLCHFRRSAGE